MAADDEDRLPSAGPEDLAALGDALDAFAAAWDQDDPPAEIDLVDPTDPQPGDTFASYLERRLGQAYTDALLDRYHQGPWQPSGIDLPPQRIPSPWPDVAGPLELTQNWHVEANGWAYRLTQHFPQARGHLRRLQAVTMIPAEMLDDLDVEPYLAMALEEWFRPWATPDAPAVPSIVLFPAVARLEGWWGRRVAGPRRRARTRRRVRRLAATPTTKETTP
jgi:hypothetical protein